MPSQRPVEALAGFSRQRRIEIRHVSGRIDHSKKKVPQCISKSIPRAWSPSVLRSFFCLEVFHKVVTATEAIAVAAPTEAAVHPAATHRPAACRPAVRNRSAAATRPARSAVARRDR